MTASLDPDTLARLVRLVIEELEADGLAAAEPWAAPVPEREGPPEPEQGPAAVPEPRATQVLVAAASQGASVPEVPVGGGIEVLDPTGVEHRRVPGIARPYDPDGLVNLMAATSARIGVGRAGPRPTTAQMLLFQADHAVTQDAIFSEVSAEVLEEFDLFTVTTRAADREEYLLRPDLGRELSPESRGTVEQRCVKAPDVQIVVGDGLSAQAITNNLGQIYPVLVQGLTGAGLTLGTPFFIRNARVGVINDLNTVIGADVVVLLIGERPGLGVADALSVYSGWQPGPGKNDANRDVTCMITDAGGMNPLEAGAFVVTHLRTVVENRASGIDLRRALAGGL